MQPLQDYLIGTRLTLAAAGVSGSDFRVVDYPKAVRRVPGFQRAELGLYEGKIAIRAALPAGIEGKPMLSAELQLQACNDEICQAPQSVALNVPVREQ